MLINRIFSGNDAVYGLTEKAVNDAVQQHGADKAVGFPHTAYCLPCYYAVTGVKIKTLGELQAALGVVKSLMTREHALDDALMSGVATALCAEFIEALKYLDGQNPIRSLVMAILQIPLSVSLVYRLYQEISLV